MRINDVVMFEEVCSISSNDIRECCQVRVLDWHDDERIFGFCACSAYVRLIYCEVTSWNDLSNSGCMIIHNDQVKLKFRLE